MQQWGYDQYDNENLPRCSCGTMVSTLTYLLAMAQGGDTGYLIARMLAQLYPEHCVAHHINMAVPREPNPEKHPKVRQL